jgi:hypothetical protein
MKHPGAAVPLIVPSLAKPRPAGNTEGAVCPGNNASDQVYGGVPPVAWSLVLYGVPVTALGKLPVVTVRGEGGGGGGPELLPPPQPENVSEVNTVATSKQQFVRRRFTSFVAP